MKNLLVMAMAAGSMLATGGSWAQNTNMMNGGMWGSGWMGGYGGMWVPILLAIVVVALIAWIARRGGK